MVRGVKELDCFEYIRTHLFNDNVSFDAMSNDDIIQVKDLFWKATPNKKPSEFPDFISDEGFIEHFEITSSDVSKAGAEYKKTMSAFDKEHKAKEEDLKTYISKKPNEIQSVLSTVSNGVHSHENLMSSLKQSLEHHINSANKYSGNSECRIYMIEYNELGLIMKIVEKNLFLEYLRHNKDYKDNNPLLLEDFHIQKGNRWQVMMHR